MLVKSIMDFIVMLRELLCWHTYWDYQGDLNAASC